MIEVETSFRTWGCPCRLPPEVDENSSLGNVYLRAPYPLSFSVHITLVESRGGSPPRHSWWSSGTLRHFPWLICQPGRLFSHRTSRVTALLQSFRSCRAFAVEGEAVPEQGDLCSRAGAPEYCQDSTSMYHRTVGEEDPSRWSSGGHARCRSVRRVDPSPFRNVNVMSTLACRGSHQSTVVSVGLIYLRTRNSLPVAARVDVIMM